MRLHLPHHRHTRSKEEPPKPPPKDAGSGHPIRPLTNRQDSMSNVRMLKDSISSPISSRNTLPLPGTSPTPSSGGAVNRSETMPNQHPPANGASGGKRSLLDKLRRGVKGEHSHHESLNVLHHLSGSTLSLHHSSEGKNYRSELANQKEARQGSVATFDSGSTAKASD